MENIGFLFPGQGAQHIGMGEILCNEYDIARRTFEEASEYIMTDMRKLCFEESMTNLNKLENMFCAILTCSVASFRVYMENIGIPPKFTAGHSLGEYSALVCADAMNFEDALKLVKFRGSVSQRIADSGSSLMAVVNQIDEELLLSICKKVCKPDNYVGISCYNSKRQFVLSGQSNAIFQMQDQVEGVGGQVTPLFMSPPFHSILMNDVAYELESELVKYNYRKPKWPIISNIYATPYQDEKDIIKYLTLQMTNPVKWTETMNYMDAKGCDIIIEMGPQAILSNLISIDNSGFRAYTFGQKDDRDYLISDFEKKIKKENKTCSQKDFIGRCLAIAVSTRNTNFDEEEYRIGVEIPYEKIESIQNELDDSGELPSHEQMVDAIKLLKSILNTKHVSLEEQANRFEELFEVTNTGNMFEDIDLLAL